MFLTNWRALIQATFNLQSTPLIPRNVRNYFGFLNLATGKLRVKLVLFFDAVTFQGPTGCQVLLSVTTMLFHEVFSSCGVKLKTNCTPVRRSYDSGDSRQLAAHFAHTVLSRPDFLFLDAPLC